MTSWPQSLARGNSEIGRQILTRDWSQTAMGPIENWPQSLRTALITALESSFPMSIGWGPHLIYFYNDAAKPIVGDKELSNALGKPAHEVYPEMWHMLQPMLSSVMQTGKSAWVQDRFFPIIRYGFTEESYFTFSYSPIREENGEVGGVLCTMIETTRQVVNERRIRNLHEMALNLSDADTVAKVCQRCLEALSRNRQDMPFCVLRLLHKEEGVAKMMGSFGVEVPDRKTSPSSSYHPAIEEVIRTKKPVLVDQIPADARLEDPMFNPEVPHPFYVMPFFLSGSDEVDGFLSIGLNPARPFDDDYKEFLRSLCAQVGMAISNAKAQEESKRNLGLLLDASPDHVFMLDREGRYVFLNQATKIAIQAHLRRIGRGNEDPLNKDARDLLQLPNFVDQFERDQERVFRGETVRGELTFDGEIGHREYEYILSPIKNEFGIVTHIAGITRDVQELKNAVKVRDQFLSIASHELKTPLTSLKLNVQMRLRQLSRGQIDRFDPEKLSKMFSDDERQINRLTRLVDDMLDISRLNSGKFSLHPEEFELKTLVLEIVDRYSTQSTLANQVITVNGEEVRGHWDRYRIEQVIINLLSNAMKYGEKNPIEIEVERIGDYARLIVRDHGPGIREDDQQRIFQLFERAVHPSGVSGLGLGLYIVRQILDTHGGTINVKSELGQGAQFIVELPLWPTKFSPTKFS